MEIRHKRWRWTSPLQGDEDDWVLFAAATNSMGIGGMGADVGRREEVETWDRGKIAEEEQTEEAGVMNTVKKKTVTICEEVGRNMDLAGVCKRSIDATPGPATCTDLEMVTGADLHPKPRIDVHALHLEQNGAAVTNVVAAGPTERLTVLEEKVPLYVLPFVIMCRKVNIGPPILKFLFIIYHYKRHCPDPITAYIEASIRFKD
jgi:hypothetical protein